VLSSKYTDFGILKYIKRIFYISKSEVYVEDYQKSSKESGFKGKKNFPFVFFFFSILYFLKSCNTLINQFASSVWCVDGTGLAMYVGLLSPAIITTIFGSESTSNPFLFALSPLPLDEEFLL